tara:strand:+ start:251 stop:871 length:621 start_codon:yes stop_codon:yes gene_type:complete
LKNRIQRQPGIVLDIVGTDYSYIMISKNASKWMEDVLELSSQINFTKFSSLDSKKYIVILRDPIDRWCSGITQYLYGEKVHRDLKNRDVLDLLFSQVHFDWHTIPQVKFLEGINTDDCIFFKMESNITNTNRLSNFQNKVVDFLETELGLDLSKSNITPFKLMDNDAGQNAQYFTKHRIHFEIQTNPRYMEQIKAYYAEDIKLYNQ